MEPDREAPSRLGAAMDKRRLELRPPLKWNQVAQRAGLSTAHLSRIRNGEATPSKLAASQIEAALEWEPGTVERIEAAPLGTPDSQPAAESPAADLPPHLADIEDPTPKEAAMLRYLASMQEEIRQLNKKVDALTSERDQEGLENGASHQRGA